MIASGDLEQARKALEMLAAGAEISKVGLEVYECDPIQVSAMLLSATGCGRDAAFGTVSQVYSASIDEMSNEEQRKWFAAFTIIDKVRIGQPDDIDPKLWSVLHFKDEAARQKVIDSAKKFVRRGHAWQWLA